MVNELFNLTPCDIPTYTSFEAVACKIATSSFSAHVICLYRLQDYPSEFFKQFEDLLVNMSSVPGELFILGDFNLHHDTPSSQTDDFTDLLSTFGLNQHVNFPTHIHLHWLDLFISRSTTQTLLYFLLVIADLKVNIQKKYLKQRITYRNTKNIDLDKFKLDIQKSDLITDPKHSVAELYNQFHKTLESLLDCHAPLKTKTVTQKPQNPWRTDTIDVAKRKRRQLERVWRRTRLPTDRSKYSKQLHLCNRLMANERRQYIRKQIHEMANSYKNLKS